VLVAMVGRPLVRGWMDAESGVTAGQPLVVQGKVKWCWWKMAAIQECGHLLSAPQSGVTLVPSQCARAMPTPASDYVDCEDGRDVAFAWGGLMSRAHSKSVWSSLQHLECVLHEPAKINGRRAAWGNIVVASAAHVTMSMNVETSKT
jgi:hypothetical protein